MVKVDEDGLHPSELSRCCVARVKVVVHGPHDRYTDYICTKCEALCTRYTLVSTGPWPPDSTLSMFQITREEWDDMQESTLPRALAIQVMLKKAARRLKDERERQPEA